MIALFTDFGLEGPYVGQVKAVLAQEAPGVAVIDLFADAPSGAPELGAYLLAAHAAWFPAGTIFLAVVDPGVGGKRDAVALEADGRWYVGPDNGLLALATRRAGEARCRIIAPDGRRLWPSFHGRDLFAPAAARLARGDHALGPEVAAQRLDRADWPDDLGQIVYIDHFGNAMTGLRASALGDGARLRVGAHSLARARTFSDVAPGAAFWYVNANDLVEIAVNRGRADVELGLALGAAIEIAAA
ncbi:MAG: SAM-dependent chlorinase/fluorinase [Alphaproteobacteria bacterium]